MKKVLLMVSMCLVNLIIQAQIITTIAGNGIAGYSGDGGPATLAKIYAHGMAVDNAGNLYVGDQTNHVIRKVNTGGLISTYAGTGVPLGPLGDGGPATGASIYSPADFTFDAAGNFYLADIGGSRIRVIDPAGIINTFAGIGSHGYSGNGGPATAADIGYPYGVAFDSYGDFYFSDANNRVIRKISGGIINEIAGGGAVPGVSGPATTAFMDPLGICIDGGNNLYVCQGYRDLITKISPNISGVLDNTCMVSIEGGWGGAPIDNCPAIGAFINQPFNICHDHCGNLYLTEYVGNKVRKINPLGIITTVAGDGTAAYTGDGGLATAAQLNGPQNVQVDNNCNIYIGDAGNTVVRKVTAIASNLQFSLSTPSLTVCNNATANFDPLLDITDNQMGQAETWTVMTPAGHGSVTGSGYALTYLGSPITPTGFTYTPTPGYSGTDAVTIQADNCLTTATVTVTITVLPAAVITGTTAICENASSTLSTSVSGGTWSSTATTISVNSTTGTVTGVTAGTATISYTTPAGCVSSVSFVVNPNPIAPTGTMTTCVGGATTLSDATAGGTWSSGATAIAAAGSSTGIITGISAGATTISYTITSTGCYSTTGFTVLTMPAITGATAICNAASTSLTDAYPGGTWTSSNTSVATAGISTGIITAVATGTATITYDYIAGCEAVTTVTVYPVPPSITGPGAVCDGATITLSDATTGGTWSSSNTAIATAGTGSGVITGIAAGTATITYVLPGPGCYATTTVTVNMTPAAITGANAICTGGTPTLSDATGGGTWSSSNTAVATAGSSGIVSGTGGGTTTIAYTTGSCAATLTMTVYTTPAAITGAAIACIGSATTMSDAVTGGTWSSSSTTIATIGSASGVVTAASTGTTTITYTTGGLCTATKTLTVNMTAASITGPTAVCTGATIMLSDAVTSGTWTSGNTTIATVGTGTGLVTGVAAGTVMISYANVCGYATVTITVNPTPTGMIGLTHVCVGSTIVLSDATPGGVWSSGNTSTGTIGATTGVLTGVAADPALYIYYIIPGTGCGVYLIKRVDALPAVISGPTSVCPATSVTLSDATTGGTWSSSNTIIASVGSSSGIVTGATSGTTTISYTDLNGCRTAQTMTVDPAPATPTGPSFVCIGTVGGMSSSPSGGTWTSSNTSVATIDAFGIVSALVAGTTSITYSVGGCPAFVTVTVNPGPAPITGTDPVCVGSVTTFSDASPGGTWQSSNTSIAIVSGGNVTGIATGTVIINFFYLSCYTTKTITVQPTPVLTTSSLICTGTNIGFGTSIGGGTWSSSNTSLATMGSASGICTGVSAGTLTITYTSPAGCIATSSLTVLPSPAGIGGTAIACQGIPTTLTDATSGGTWSSGSTGVAVIGSAGTYTGVAGGTTIITYTGSNGCLAIKTITINPLPGTIIGPSAICNGSSVSLTDANTGGTWTSSNSTVAAIGSSTGILSTSSPGTTTITYTLPTGCSITTTVTVDPAVSGITGPTAVCAGSSIALTDPTTGGTWTSSNTGIATVGGTTGIVAGVAGGVVTISYSKGACTQVHTVTVNALPAGITGLHVVCTGNTITLSDATAGGTWSSSATTTATIGNTTGVVGPVAAGVVVMTYKLTTTGCYTSYTVTVGAAVGAITGGPMACVGATMTLTDATPGGTWASSTTTIATVAALGSTNGIVTPLTAGVTTITYQTSPACVVYLNIQVWDEACSPCTILGNDFEQLGASGTISSTVTGAKLYYVNNPVTIRGGSVLFTGAKLMMAPGAQITVRHDTKLTLDISHLLGCAMWPGIELQTSGLYTGQLSIVNNSLIEDADVAVKIITPGSPGTGSGNILESDGAMFNRNRQGIRIENYTPASTTYPFLIRNTTFTSRDFAGISNYPGTWPDNTGSFGLKSPWTPTDVYTPPLAMNNPGGYIYYNTVCKDGSLPYCGIWLSNIGTVTPGTTLSGTGPIPSAYFDITVGDDAPTTNNDNMNVFDNMMVGIYAYRTNLTCVNNMFTNMAADNSVYAWPTTGGGTPPPYMPTGDGVYAGSDMDVTHQCRLQLYQTTGSTYKNWFYGFDNGVECVNYYCMNLRNSEMINQTPMYPSPGYRSGSYGYKLSSWNYNAIDVNDNIVNNVVTGIALWQLNLPLGRVGFPYPPLPVVQYTGQCNINNNLIQAYPHTGGLHVTNEAVLTGIAVQNAMATYTLYGLTTMTGQLTIDNNQVKDAYNGVYVNYSFSQNAVTSNNAIYLRPVGSSALYYGVNHTACTDGMMWSNYTTLSAGTSGDYLRGYYANSNTGLTIACNTADQVGRGFEFFTSNPGMNWAVNTMQNNIKGMVLNGGLIGDQGSSTYANNNQWAGTWSLSSTSGQTYVYNGADANLNKLYVHTGIGNPTFNAGYTGFLVGKNYTPGSSVVIATTGGIASCPPPHPHPADGMHMFEDMARNSFIYMANATPKKWMNQYMLWRQLQIDTALVDSSTTIAQFATMVQHSRYAYLTNIENALATGDLTTAATLLTYDIDTLANTDTDAVTGVRIVDSVTSDHIVLNYKQFYGLYVKYIDSAMNHEDSMNVLAIAQLCPHTEGMVVYQARALYSYIFNDMNMFNDDSCLNSDTTYVGEWKHGGGSITAQDIGGQGYQLFPNPNDGNITLRQQISDTGSVRLEIFDMVGRTVYKDKLVFSNKTSKLHLTTVIPGMYILQLISADDKIYRFKFVKE